MEMYCPHCQSTDLRKVSLVYQQGRFGGRAQTRLRGLLLGTGGPDLIFGSARTIGVQQSQLSKNVQPPSKWSYLRLLGWFLLGSFVALVSYVNSVMSHRGQAASLPVTLYVVIGSCVFFFLVFLVWRHNHSVYPRQYIAWERSFLCQRCGSVNAQSLAVSK